MRSSSGEVKKCSGVPVYDLTGLHEDNPVGDLASEAHFVGDDHHGHAAEGQFLHDVEYLFDHFRIERRGRLVEEHDPRFHGEGAGDGYTLLLSARELTGELLRLFGDADPFEQLGGQGLGFRPRLLADPDGRP